MSSPRHPPHRRSPIPVTPPDNGFFIIFELLSALCERASSQLRRDHSNGTVTERRLDVQLWLIVQSAWNAHLTGRELYVGDLLRPGITPEALRDSVVTLIELGWLADARIPSLSQNSQSPADVQQGWAIRLTPEGARRSQALATDLLRTIHEHCSLAGINPFERRTPAWGDLNNRPQTRSNRRSRHHPRQS